MKFGDVPVGDAVGAVLAHSVFAAGQRLRKGRVLTRDDAALLRDAGIETVAAVRLEAGDAGEDDAAARVAVACAGAGLKAGNAHTGRCNLIAETVGLVIIDADRVDRLNRVDEAVTLATLSPFEAVEAGQVVATVKIVTFAVPDTVLAETARIAAAPDPLIRVAAFRPVQIGLIQTVIPGMKQGMTDKGEAVTRERLVRAGSDLSAGLACSHDASSVARALKQLSSLGCNIALVLGASAIVDRRDVVPRAVEEAGGMVEHLGMPVDPGHLTMLARIGIMRVLGLPGSARSPRLHGFDWIIQRLVAGLDVTADDITHMGVGGLLKEIPGRPVPREGAATPSPDKAPRKVAALILAAGQSRRMGAVNKMLAEIDGLPMVAHVVDAALASRADPVIVVTGHEEQRIRAALESRDVAFAHNPNYAEGLSTSLRRGLAALPADVDGVVVCLGDMPSVTPTHLNLLIACFDPDAGKSICVPTYEGKRGNPVLWDRRYFREITEVAGDVGARHLIGAHDDKVTEVPMPDPGVLLDLDTPQALAAHLDRRKSGA